MKKTVVISCIIVLLFASATPAIAEKGQGSCYPLNGLVDIYSVNIDNHTITVPIEVCYIFTYTYYSYWKVTVTNHTNINIPGQVGRESFDDLEAGQTVVYSYYDNDGVITARSITVMK